ncbi:MAG: methyl-accepting chemotaxis protein [Chloroflexi bacterium]|nr:methyl-accepting chemotaxis protein [Chloroflexota bacterium]OJV94174.1 MAG: hypothetical protein BGO39_11955 [Chloroflexi bacterium 54-19]
MLKGLVSAFQRLHWPLRVKLGLAFGILLVIFLINGAVSLVLLNLIKNSEDSQRQTTLSLERVERYSLIFNNGQLSVYYDAIFYSPRRSAGDNFRTIILQEMKNRDPGQPFLGSTAFDAEFQEAYQAASDKLYEADVLLRNGQFQTAKERWPTYGPTFTKVTDLLKSQEDFLTKARDSSIQESTNAINLSTYLIAGLTIFSVVLAVAILYLLQHAVVRPLNYLQGGLLRLSQGHFDRMDGQIPNQDEIGKLALSFQTAVGSIKNVLQGVQITGTLRNVTEKLAVVSKQQQSGTAAQTAALSQVLTSMQELGQTAAMIATTTSDVAGLSQQTLVQIDRVAQSGVNSQERTNEVSSVVTMTINRVEEIGQQVEEFSRAMNELNGQAIAINKVVELLGSIAEEVHLLALNAAIEAASAGEYGERFRVVAREIKDLAHRANRSTQEAQNLVYEVQQSSQSTQQLVERGRALISTVHDANTRLSRSLNGLETSGQEVAEAVHSLVSMANQVNERTEEIRQATQQQHTASEQVLIAIRSVSEVADQTATSTELIVTSSSQLDNLTHQLGSVLNRVQLAA